tara:strand:- start:56172 stop:57011 length:840 start_codon:yes stop_codon:yes gene_type:complete
VKLATIISAALCTALATTAVISQSAHAHRVWLKPSTTVVSGDDEWITFDAAIANGIFNPDHYAYPLERLTAIGPDGQAVALENSAKLRYRSVFDLHLQQQGTYRVFNASRSIVARWVDAEGERHYWPGRGKTGTLAQFKQQVPSDAKELQVSDVARRMETFVTLGAPNDTAITPSGQGLELNALTHPNDLYVDESAPMQLLIDGQPAVGAKVTLVRQGERYRDSNIATQLTADDNGQIELQFTQPGMYWFEAEYEDQQAKAPAQTRRGSYVAVFEVLPL